MCGIAGVLGLPLEIARPAAERMQRALAHRGPDDSGLEVIADPTGQAPPIVLAQTRLAILDLSPAGHQPMSEKRATGRGPSSWIVFNGEIFNFRELRGELEQAGHPSASQSDTEVILHAARAWGVDSVERMRGMFAWCLVNVERRQAWFCRDRMGIKPLYMARPAQGGLLFASEVRALLAAGSDLVPPRANPAAIESFLAQGAVSGLESIIAGAELLPPGESRLVDWKGATQSSRRYWQCPFPREGTPRSDRAEAVAQLASTLREAVKLRLVSDVPLGFFLSGGIDSASLVAVASEVAGAQVHTITIGFDQPEFDESAEAERLAKTFGTKHQTVRLTGSEVLAGLEGVLAAVDQPTVDGFNTYFVSRATRAAGLTVALSGTGGDELFGGYASFRDVPRALALRRRLRWLPAGLAAKGASWLPGRGGAKARELFRREASPLAMYLLRRELFLPDERRAMHDLPPLSDPASGLPRTLLAEHEERTRGTDLLNQVASFELHSYLRDMLLRDADVFSMVHGLEVRVPLLDHRLVEQASALPGEWRKADPRPKPLLIDAVGHRLPAEVYQRRKRGFTFPWDAWIRGPWRERAAAAVNDRAVWDNLGIRPAAPLAVWQRFLANDPRVAPLAIIALVMLGDFARRHGLRLE